MAITRYVLLQRDETKLARPYVVNHPLQRSFADADDADDFLREVFDGGRYTIHASAEEPGVWLRYYCGALVASYELQQQTITTLTPEGRV